MNIQLEPIFQTNIPDYLGLHLGLGGGALLALDDVFLLFPLQGLPGVPGKRGEMGRPVKIFRVYYADSTGSPTSHWLHCTGGP